MVFGTDRTNRSSGTAVSRRTVLHSGASVAAAGYLTYEMGTASAQAAGDWPMQGFDPQNTHTTTQMEPLTGEPAAIVEVDVPVGPPANYLLSEGRAYLHTPEDGIGAVDIQTGELVWQTDTEYPVTPEGIADGQLVMRRWDGAVDILDAESGDRITQQPLDHGYGLGQNGDGHWFAPISDGALAAFDDQFGEPRWETEIEGVGVRPAVDDERVFVATVDSVVERVDDYMWDHDEMGAEGRLYAIDPDGTIAWEKSRVEAGIGSPVVRNGMVYWAGADGDILTFDAETGERRWEYKTDGSFPRTPAATSELVLAGNRNGLYAVDAETGEEVGQIPTGSPVMTSPVVVDGIVYFGTADGTVYAVETETGDQLWQFDAQWSVESLVPGDDRLVVGTSAGYFVLASDDTADDSTTSDATEPSNANTGFSGETDSNTGSDGPESRQRGLFSNNGDEPEAISNPFNLTLLGFLLSVVGIAYQMLEGR